MTISHGSRHGIEEGIMLVTENLLKVFLIHFEIVFYYTQKSKKEAPSLTCSGSDWLISCIIAIAIPIVI